MQEKRILILEDEMLQALDLNELLIAEGYVTQIADNFKSGIHLINEFKPHLILCDINLKETLSGIDFAKEVSLFYSKGEFIFITAITKQAVLDEAVTTDPLNFIVKPWKEDQIKVTLHLAFQYILSKQDTHAEISSLSMAEYKIVKLIAKQKSTKEIAQMLFLSEKTIKNHRHNIVKKLQLNNETNSLLKWAIQHFPK